MTERGSDWSRVTELLRAMAGGDHEAEERVVALLYDHLRQRAAAYMADQRPGHVLRATALVHEAYVKLARAPRFEWESRGQFTAAAARAMRQVLVDHARAAGARKRSGGDRVPLDDFVAVFERSSGGLLDLHAALDELGAEDPRAARVVELRFFAGLSMPEIADMVGLSQPTVERDWAFARAWLRRRLS